MGKLFSFFLIILTIGIYNNKTYVKNYYNNKNIKEKGWMLEDKRTDYWFFYYENGNKKQEGHYLDNKKTKWWVFYDDQENILKKCEYKNNLLNGLTIIYTNNKIVKVEKYIDGEKIKTWTDLREFKKDNTYF